MMENLIQKAKKNSILTKVLKSGRTIKEEEGSIICVNLTENNTNFQRKI